MILRFSVYIVTFFILLNLKVKNMIRQTACQLSEGGGLRWLSGIGIPAA
jgi:hypothetical protein